MPIKSTTQYKTANEELFALYAENKDQRVRNRIVELNLGLVKKKRHPIGQINVKKILMICYRLVVSVY